MCDFVIPFSILLCGLGLEMEVPGVALVMMTHGVAAKMDALFQVENMTCHQLTSQQCKIHQPKFNKRSIHQIQIQQ